jgi:hypothetical protein
VILFLVLLSFSKKRRFCSCAKELDLLSSTALFIVVQKVLFLSSALKSFDVKIIFIQCQEEESEVELFMYQGCQLPPDWFPVPCFAICHDF